MLFWTSNWLTPNNDLLIETVRPLKIKIEQECFQMCGYSGCDISRTHMCRIWVCADTLNIYRILKQNHPYVREYFLDPDPKLYKIQHIWVRSSFVNAFMQTWCYHFWWGCSRGTHEQQIHQESFEKRKQLLGCVIMSVWQHFGTACSLVEAGRQ